MLPNNPPTTPQQPDDPTTNYPTQHFTHVPIPDESSLVVLVKRRELDQLLGENLKLQQEAKKWQAQFEELHKHKETLTANYIADISEWKKKYSDDIALLTQKNDELREENKKLRCMNDDLAQRFSKIEARLKEEEGRRHKAQVALVRGSSMYSFLSKLRSYLKVDDELLEDIVKEVESVNSPEWNKFLQRAGWDKEIVKKLAQYLEFTRRTRKPIAHPFCVHPGCNTYGCYSEYAETKDFLSTKNRKEQENIDSLLHGIKVLSQLLGLPDDDFLVH